MRYNLIHKKSGWTSERLWRIGVSFPGRLNREDFFKENRGEIAAYMEASGIMSSDEYSDFVWVPVGRLKL